MRLCCIELDTEGRTLLFRDYVYKFVTTFRDHLHSYLLAVNENTELFEVRDLLITTLSNAIRAVNVECAKSGMPELFIENIQIDNASINVLITSLQNAFNSTYLKDNYQYIDVCLQHINSFVLFEILRSEEISNRLNGTLSGTIYKDQVV